MWENPHREIIASISAADLQRFPAISGELSGLGGFVG
jgi:hypothetical protein